MTIEGSKHTEKVWKSVNIQLVLMFAHPSPRYWCKRLFIFLVAFFGRDDKILLTT